MRSLKQIFSFVITIAFFGLMSFTVAPDFTNSSAENLKTAEIEVADVEGKWRHVRTIINDNGSITKVYRCVQGGTQCVVGTIAKVTTFPIGDL